MTFTGLAAKGIERILERSGDADIQRRHVAKGSPAFARFDGSDSGLRQSARPSHSASTTGRILRRSRPIRILQMRRSGWLRNKRLQPIHRLN